MTCPYWSGFVLLLPFGKVDANSFYSLSARRVTYATAISYSCVPYSPLTEPTLGTAMFGTTSSPFTIEAHGRSYHVFRQASKLGMTSW
jgi:hypothetical protein